MSLFTEDQSVKFEDYVGEGKKYKTNDDVAKAIAEKDRFIEQLKQEKAEVLRDLQARPAVDNSQAILDRMEELARRIPQPVTTSVEHQPTERTVVNGLTEQDVLRVLTEREQTARRQANLDQVKADLKIKYGPNYSQVLTSLQNSMGVGGEFLDNVASQSPAAFMKLLDGQKADPVFTPPSSTTPPVFNPTGQGAQPRSFYVKLKQADKARYDSSAVQNQMYKDAMALGESYFDTSD